MLSPETRARLTLEVALLFAARSLCSNDKRSCVRFVVFGDVVPTGDVDILVVNIGRRRTKGFESRQCRPSQRLTVPWPREV